ncbi:MAG: hypothetical protein Q7S76_00590 [bacterium]|nr:hypothetical protein [bacterium]
MNEREYQLEVRSGLNLIYEDVQVQWSPFRREGRDMYAPILDIAVGPFAMERRYENEYTQTLIRTQDFIESLIQKHNENIERDEEWVSFAQILHFNENARCFLAIEIEHTGSRKHCLGNLVNASALGRVALLVARSEEVLRIFLRQRVYLARLAGYGKNTFKTDNCLVLTENQLNICLTALADSITVPRRVI